MSKRTKRVNNHKGNKLYLRCLCESRHETKVKVHQRVQQAAFWQPLRNPSTFQEATRTRSRTNTVTAACLTLAYASKREQTAVGHTAYQ